MKEDRKRLILPDEKAVPDLSRITQIILKDYDVIRQDVADYLKVSVGTINRLKQGHRHTANYVIVSGLVELALANFDIDQLEECRVI